jgi:flavin reductase (DIM6/NTAB) family NADH-FMN oxidoreductase RutF
MHQEHTNETLSSLDRFTRANLINSLSGYKPVSLIATCDAQGNTNLAVFSNIVHLGADPALVGFVNRPREAAPHTLANIESTGLFTINHIHPGMMAQAHQTSAKYPQGVSEFQAVGLTPDFSEGVSVPYVHESRIKYRLRLVEVVHIPHNQTYFVIGAIEHMLFPKSILEPDGFLRIDQAESMVSLGIDGYSTVAQSTRFPYAKP